MVGEFREISKVVVKEFWWSGLWGGIGGGGLEGEGCIWML
jgi:hypothetical protein